MGNPLGEGGETTEPPVGSVPEQQGTPGINPAWNDFLADIPQELHEKVTPKLQEWDSGVQKMVQKVHSEYEPWKPVLDTGADPDMVMFGLNVLNSLEQDPETVYKALGEFYGFDKNADPTVNEQGQEPSGNNVPDDPYDNRIKQVEEQNQVLAGEILKQREKEQTEREDAALDAELNKVREKFKDKGDIDEMFLLTRMSAGYSAEDAATEYFNWRENQLKARVPKPIVMGSGGGLPGQPDVTKLDDKGTRNLITELLKAQNQGNQ